MVLRVGAVGCWLLAEGGGGAEENINRVLWAADGSDILSSGFWLWLERTKWTCHFPAPTISRVNPAREGPGSDWDWDTPAVFQAADFTGLFLQLQRLISKCIWVYTRPGVGVSGGMQ